MSLNLEAGLARVEGKVDGVMNLLRQHAEDENRRLENIEETQRAHSRELATLRTRVMQLWVIGPLVVGLATVLGIFWRGHS